MIGMIHLMIRSHWRRERRGQQTAEGNEQEVFNGPFERKELPFLRSEMTPNYVSTPLTKEVHGRQTYDVYRRIAVLYQNTLVYLQD